MYGDLLLVFVVLASIAAIVVPLGGDDDG